MPTLTVDNIHTYYSNIHAIKGLSLTVGDGEIVTLIGANGAGKSTTLRTISGLLRPRMGSVSFDGRRIDALPAHQIVRLGICQSPEGRRIFAKMTVRENLEMGGFSRTDSDQMRTDMEWVLGLFPRLRERLGQKGGTLSGGEQQMLAIGRALMSKPRLLLLDEPSMGLSPLLVGTIFDTVRHINEGGTAILLVEQNAAMALGVAHRGYVLESGVIVAHDTAKTLAASELVRKSYLGED